MSEIVDADQSLLAAEFVLGTLDADERSRANELLRRDQPFGELVSLWERRLGELHLMVEPVEPSPEIWNRIRRRVLGAAAPVEAPAPVEPPPRVEAPEVVPESSAADRAIEPQLEMDTPERETPKDPEWTAQAEAAEAAPAGTPEAADPEADRGGVPFAAVEAALQAAAARRAEPEAPVLPTPPPPEPGMPSEPQVPKRQVVHDLRAERGVFAARDLKEHKRAARGGGAWRAFGPLMTIIAAALAGLIVAWRYVPDRLPPQLQPSALLHIAPTPATMAKQPPRRLTSQFEE
ncbi:MAG TPA: hypothetical protein VH684_25895 [Xanthobacteraceae bacterium]|jgi:hypothetical protein